ncbi:MAG: Glycosyl transferase, family 9 [Parcubacteria group bacterium GW2011_GWA2_47_12]|nr:MAG: Glycosyl transferase, family 9 [Parcubacteria group bacterium GW2011_GWA2_47_12]
MFIYMLFGERLRFAFYAALGMLLSPALFFVGMLRRNTTHSPSDARILVIPIMTRVGDLVCATPVFRALKMRYPHCRLSVLVAKNVAGIVRHNPRIDEIIVMNNPPFKGFWGRGRFFLFLFRQHFDSVVALSNNPFGSLAALWSAAPVRIKTTVRPRTFVEALTDWWNTRCVRYGHGSFLQAHYIHLLASLGVPFTEPKKEIFVTEAGEYKAEEFFKAEGISARDLRIGVSVSAGNTIKEWPTERFASLAARLISEKTAKIIFIDTQSNENKIEKTLAAMKNKKNISIATNFTLEELPSLMKRLNMFIAVDTGAIYVAHALGVPLVDIIGPVEPNEQPPRDERSVQILPPPRIRPSSFVIARPGAFSARRDAVLSIPVSAVYDAAAQLLSKIYGK